MCVCVCAFGSVQFCQYIYLGSMVLFVQFLAECYEMICAPSPGHKMGQKLDAAPSKKKKRKKKKKKKKAPACTSCFTKLKFASLSYCTA